MNKNTGIIVGVIALVVVVGGIYASMNNKDDVLVVNEQVEQKIIEDQKTAEEKVLMPARSDVEQFGGEKEVNIEVKKEDVMMKAGSYEAYAGDKVMLASATNDVVLFFKANWCPSCRAVDADIKANLSKIPSSLTILEVNYDSSSDLKKKYGVTYQHTFVQVNKEGNLIKKWSGSGTLAKLVAEVK